VCTVHAAFDAGGEGLHRCLEPLVQGGVPPCLQHRDRTLGPVDPLFRALSRRLMVPVRRHKLNKDSLFYRLTSQRFEIGHVFGNRFIGCTTLRPPAGFEQIQVWDLRYFSSGRVDFDSASQEIGNRTSLIWSNPAGEGLGSLISWLESNKSRRRRSH